MKHVLVITLLFTCNVIATEVAQNELAVNYIDDLLTVKSKVGVEDENINEKLPFLVLRAFHSAFNHVKNKEDAHAFVSDLSKVYNHNWRFNREDMTQLMAKHTNESLSEIFVILKAFNLIYNFSKEGNIHQQRERWGKIETSMH